MRPSLQRRWTRRTHRRCAVARSAAGCMKHEGFAVWLTGLSGAGKSTLAERLVDRLREQGAEVELLDGDFIRTNLSQGLGFSREDRDTNIHRIGFVAELLARHGIIVVVAAISP